MRISFFACVISVAGHIYVPVANAIQYSPAAMNLFERSDAHLLCQPTDGFSNADSTPFPCNKEFATLALCAYPLAFDGTNPTAEHLNEEQKCICDTNGAGNVIWRYAVGCQDCLRLHGGYYATGDDLNALSSSYCGSSPTVQFKTLRSSFLDSILSTQSATQLNALGTRTEVSLYWTDVPTGAGSVTTSKATPTKNAETSQNGNTETTPTGTGATAPTSNNAAHALVVSNLLIPAIAGLIGLI